MQETVNRIDFIRYVKTKNGVCKHCETRLCACWQRCGIVLAQGFSCLKNLFVKRTESYIYVKKLPENFVFSILDLTSVIEKFKKKKSSRKNGQIFTPLWPYR